MLWVLPVSAVCLSLVIIGISTLRDEDNPQACPQEFAINPDIGGIGVLLGLFVPSVALAIALLLGHKTSEPFGAKELCLAHMASIAHSLNIDFWC